MNKDDPSLYTGKYFQCLSADTPLTNYVEKVKALAAKHGGTAEVFIHDELEICIPETNISAFRAEVQAVVDEELTRTLGAYRTIRWGREK